MPKHKVGDLVRCSPEEPEYCNGRSGELCNISQINDGTAQVIFEDGTVMYFWLSELDKVNEMEDAVC